LIALATYLIVDGISFALIGPDLIALNGWTDGWSYAVYSYVVAPLVATAYVWVSLAAAEMFRKLRDSDALVASEADCDEFVTVSLRKVYTHPGWSIAALIVVTLLAVYFTVFFTFSSLGASTSTIRWSPVALTLRTVKVILLYVPGWYMVCQIVARELATIWGLWQVFRRFEVSPHPLHPDRCGGLRAINDYVVGFTYVIALTGLGVVVLSYVTWRSEGSLRSWDMVALLSVYIFIGLGCFFLPPWTAHNAMAEAKRRLLDDISQRFQHNYLEVTTGLGDEQKDWEQLIDRVQGLHTLYDLTEEFPVWPFDTRTLRRFVAAVSVPIIPLAIEVIVSLTNSVFRLR
jgi:hypothetical protein